MPFASHRLDVLLVGAVGRDLDQDAVADLFEREGWTRDGLPGPQYEALSLGRFARVAFDRPPRPTLYGSRLGGFRVRCPRCTAPVASEFSRAVEALRVDRDATFDCPACGAHLDPGSAVTEPRIAFGPWAIAWVDVEQPDPSPVAVSRIESLVGPLSIVLRRV